MGFDDVSIHARRACSVEVRPVRPEASVFCSSFWPWMMVRSVSSWLEGAVGYVS